MTDLSDLLRPDAVLTDAVLSGKKALFGQLGVMLAQPFDLDPRLVADRLTDRERLGTTGFGNGVAIPHGRVPNLPGVTGAFIRLAQPIDVGAIDGLPVDLVFGLLSPVERGADHLKALARVSRRMRDVALLGKLRGAGSRDAVFALLTTGAHEPA